MTLDFTVTLTDELYRELIEATKECQCSPKQFAAESLESVLASRRLPKVKLGKHGARIGRPEADEDVVPEGYPLHCPEGISNTE